MVPHDIKFFDKKWLGGEAQKLANWAPCDWRRQRSESDSWNSPSHGLHVKHGSMVEKSERHSQFSLRWNH